MLATRPPCRANLTSPQARGVEYKPREGASRLKPEVFGRAVGVRFIIIGSGPALLVASSFSTQKSAREKFNRQVVCETRHPTFLPLWARPGRWRRIRVRRALHAHEMVQKTGSCSFRLDSPPVDAPSPLYTPPDRWLLKWFRTSWGRQMCSTMAGCSMDTHAGRGAHVGDGQQSSSAGRDAACAAPCRGPLPHHRAWTKCDAFPLLRSGEQAEAIEKEGIRPDVFLLINVRAYSRRVAVRRPVEHRAGARHQHSAPSMLLTFSAPPRRCLTSC